MNTSSRPATLRHNTPEPVGSLPSPFRHALIIGAIIFFSEFLLTLLLTDLPSLPIWLEGFFHGIGLLILLVPACHFMYRSFWENQCVANEKIYKLHYQLIETAETERERLAHDIHDDAGQYITALKLAAAALARTPSANAPELQEQIHHLDQLIDQTQQRVHLVVTKLRSPDLVNGGLINALKELTARCTKQFPQTRITFITRGYHDDSFPIVDTVLYRICQESICNAVRHGLAKLVEVTFVCEPDEIRLSVVDNGHGLSPADTRSNSNKIGGAGLQIMRERVSAVGGHLTVKSIPNQHTSIEAIIPTSDRRMA